MRSSSAIGISVIKIDASFLETVIFFARIIVARPSVSGNRVERRILLQNCPYISFWSRPPARRTSEFSSAASVSPAAPPDVEKVVLLAHKVSVLAALGAPPA